MRDPRRWLNCGEFFVRAKGVGPDEGDTVGAGSTVCAAGP